MKRPIVYRTTTVLPKLVPSEPEGPLIECPLCGTEYLVRKISKEKSEFTKHNVRACTGRHWFWRLFGGGCSRRSLHGHQWCSWCKAEWTISCAPMS
jgi:hypothetical protein